jgi:hypothetical protein
MQIANSIVYRRGLQNLKTGAVLPMTMALINAIKVGLVLQPLKTKSPRFKNSPKFWKKSTIWCYKSKIF